MGKHGKTICCLIGKGKINSCVVFVEFLPQTTERLKSIDLRAHLQRRRTYPGVFPVLHLDHIYYEGNVEVVKVELPRTRRSLMASDHLPLIAELRVQFS